MDITNGVLFLTAVGLVMMAWSLWQLLKPRDMPDIDAAAYDPKTVDDLPNWRFMAAWGGGIPQHADKPKAGPRGIWDNELTYYEEAMKRRLAKAREEAERPQ